MEISVDGVLWERAARYRRIAAALSDDEMKRKRNYVARLGSPMGKSSQDEVPQHGRKPLAAD
jgi:hypothetical protein